MTTTHHTPPEPGAIRSIVAPHMAVLGTYRDMLRQDVELARSLLTSAEADLEDALTDWQHSHGPARGVRRQTARLWVERVRRRRGDYDAAFGRLCGDGKGRVAA